MTIKLSDDTDHNREVLAAIKRRDGYCPCAIFETEDTKCLCRGFREQTEPGPCACGLYVKYAD